MEQKHSLTPIANTTRNIDTTTTTTTATITTTANNNNSYSNNSCGISNSGSTVCTSDTQHQNDQNILHIVHLQPPQPNDPITSVIVNLPPKQEQEQEKMQEQEPKQNLDEDQQQHVSTVDPELLPVNWPKHVKYLIDYEYHSSIPTEILDLVQGRRRKMSDYQGAASTAALGLGSRSGSESDDVQETQQQWNEDPPRSELELQYDDIPIGHAIPGILRAPTITPSSSPSSFSSLPSTSSLPSSSLSCPSASHPHQQKSQPPYEIRLITGPPSHPVLGSYGLFATTTLRPGLHLLDYISLVVPDAYADPESDHTLYLSNDLNLDASVHGNHGRFVNDFRRIRTQEQGPNVSWDLYRDAETGQIRMGCKVLKRIRPDEEILCTYGKAYWKSRGIMVKGKEWEDGWDTDLDDQSDDEKDDDDDDNGI